MTKRTPTRQTTPKMAKTAACENAAVMIGNMSPTRKEPIQKMRFAVTRITHGQFPLIARTLSFTGIFLIFSTFTSRRFLNTTMKRMIAMMPKNASVAEKPN